VAYHPPSCDAVLNNVTVVRLGTSILLLQSLLLLSTGSLGLAVMVFDLMERSSECMEQTKKIISDGSHSVQGIGRLTC
jgi:hypothetical protein